MTTSPALKKLIKHTLIILLFIFSLTASSGQNNATKNDLTDLKLKGKIQSITDTYFKPIEKQSVYQTGDVIYKNLIHFDKDGNTDKFKKINYNTIINLDKTLTNKYKYDDKGNLIEWGIYYLNKLKDLFNYKYDSIGNLIEENTYTSNDILQRKRIFNYDNSANLIEEDWYTGSSNTITLKILYKYDDNGNEIEQTYYSSNGKISKCIFMYEFDNTGNWIKQTQYLDNVANNIRIHQIVYYPN